MSGVSLFLRLVRWDVLREVRRRDAMLNMSLLAVLIVFTGHVGTQIFSGHFVGDWGLPEDRRGEATQLAGYTLGPIFFWIATLFAGTVGLNQSFAVEREGGALTGVVTAPVDPGTFYLAKVASTWLYVMTMELVLFGAYVVLFNLPVGASWLPVLLSAAVFSLAYVAPGIVLAAMTTTLKGAGEVVLRILVFVLMIPLLLLTLEISAQTFGVARPGDVGRVVALGDFDFSDYLWIALAFSAIYLTAGYVLFAKVLEE